MDEYDDDEQKQEQEPAIDYSKIDPEKLPQEVVHRSPHFKGVVNEVTSLRDANRQLQLQVNERREKPDEDEPDEELADDDYITRAVMEKKLQKQREEIEAEQKQKEAAALQVSQNRNTATFLEEMNVIKTGPGLDGKTVLETTVRHLQANDPEMFDLLMRKEDAAKRLYDYGIATLPELKERATSVRNESFLATLKKGGGARGGAGSPGGGAGGNNLLKLIGTPDTDLLAQIEEEELGGE